MVSARTNRGFTLIEMLVSVAVLAAIAVAMTGMIMEMLQSYSAQREFTDQDAQARLAMERMVRELRDVRSPADLSAAGASITFTDTSGAAITYSEAGGLLQRNGVTLADGASGLLFSYFDSAGAASGAAQTYYVQVRFTLTTAGGVANTLRGLVHPRNFP